MRLKKAINAEWVKDCTVYKWKLLCKAGDTYVVYKKGYLRLYRALGGKAFAKIRLPMSRKNRWLGKIRVLERTLRLEPRLAIAVSEQEILLSFQGKIYNIHLQTGRVYPEHHFRSNMNNVLNFCTVADGETKRIIYGEYWPNKEKNAVCIFERCPDGQWKKVFVFEPAQVKHIHQIVYDRYRKCFWISTGDDDKEAGIWCADEHFHTVTPAYVGEQQYRSCFVISTETGLLFPTDTPIADNSINFLRLKDNTFTQEYALPGPCIYGKRLDEHKFVLATSIECDPKCTLKHGLLKDELAVGVADRYSHLILGSDDLQFYEIAKFKKDWWRLILLFGNIMFPDIQEDNTIYLTGQALNRIDAKTVKIEIKKN